MRSSPYPSPTYEKIFAGDFFFFHSSGKNEVFSWVHKIGLKIVDEKGDKSIADSFLAIK